MNIFPVFPIAQIILDFGRLFPPRAFLFGRQFGEKMTDGMLNVGSLSGLFRYSGGGSRILNIVANSSWKAFSEAARRYLGRTHMYIVA